MGRISSNYNFITFTDNSEALSYKKEENASASIFNEASTLEIKKVNNTQDRISKKINELKSKLKPTVPKLSNNFLKEIINISNEIKCSPEDLLAIMYEESDGWNPASKNKTSNGNLYGGLIQMNQESLNLVKKKYSKELGLNPKITMSEYLKLPREKQIKYSEGYLKLMVEYCNLENKKHISGGELWGMLKSPKQTRNKNQKFFNKLELKIKNIKKEIFNTNSKHIDIKNA